MATHYIPTAADDESSHSLQANQFLFAEFAKRFLLAGNSTFTVRSKRTMKRFTFRLKQADSIPGRESDRPWFASLLTGPDNSNDFKYFGFIKFQNDYGGGAYNYVHGRPGKSCAARSAESVQAFVFTVFNILNRNRIPTEVEFWHEGRCGRCGRKLTDPESIERGFGPECSGKIGG